MKRLLLIGCLFMALLKGSAQGEIFVKRKVISGLNSAWEITYGPNDSLWVTENFSYLVSRINISNGTKTTLLDLSSKKNFSNNDGGRWPQGGLMGMALHPNLYSSDPAVRGAKPWVYLAYVFSRPTGQTCSTDANSSNPCNFYTRIVRYNYSGNTLSGAVTILDSIPGSNDHNSGRMTIGPDLKLYYTIGDQGAGQFNNASRTNHAQVVDVMEGKILRLNTETDGDSGKDAWVPNDNPFYDGSAITPKDYVFSMGHRNAQGLVWAHIGSSDILYSSEHGDKTDDEVNLITAGSNYGWNEVSGYCDGNYNGLTLGGKTSIDETTFCSTTAVKQPITTFFTLTKAQINALSSDYLTWPTVAPSSIEFYPGVTIPGWQNSLLIPCLKAGRVYRIRLNSTGDGLLHYSSGVDTISYFRGDGRFRDLAISPDGLKIYVACDNSGQTSGPTGSFNGGGTAPPNAGAILEYSYTGPVLALREDPPGVHPVAPDVSIKIFPNPTTQNLTISVKAPVQKPLIIRIFNATGILMQDEKSTKSEITLSTSALKPGPYYIFLFDAYGKVLAMEKIIKI